MSTVYTVCAMKRSVVDYLRMLKANNVKERGARQTSDDTSGEPQKGQPVFFFFFF